MAFESHMVFKGVHKNPRAFDIILCKPQGFHKGVCKNLAFPQSCHKTLWFLWNTFTKVLDFSLDFQENPRVYMKAPCKKTPIERSMFLQNTM